ncbi:MULTISPECIES: hypothetical protein [Nocardioides]|uniref:Uncharacterized protein n=1 Tax=Nocardioides vastitatis TaxID=2568655 RepID=A0ABW0ZET3_9ACTN|nr:hypothetical protein [Nocardioides sp.]THJ04337.1 hypothetical protein E7Z54_08995 [Nocardioides sp.]
MTVIAVVAHPEARAALEAGWVIDSGRADLVDTGLCAMHPAPTGASAAERAMAIVRSLRDSLGDDVVHAATAELLCSALTTAEHLAPGRGPLGVAAELLASHGLARHLVDAEPAGSGIEPPMAATSPLPALPLTALVGSARAILQRVSAWDEATRRLHWDAALAGGRDVVVVAATEPAVTDLNLYGLIRHSGRRAMVFIEDSVPLTVADRFVPRHVARVGVGTLLRLA